MEESDLLKDIDNLQEKLKCLKLVDQQAQQPSSLANEIRTALKNIGACCVQINSTTKTLTPKIHEILKFPLLKIQSDQGRLCDGDVSNVLSYLKLVAEISPPVQPKEPGVEPLDDTFWNEIIEPVCTDILDFLNVSVFKRCLSFLSTSKTIPNQNGDVEVSNLGTGFAFHQTLGVLQKGVRILLVYLKRATSNLKQATEKKLARSLTEILKVMCLMMNPKEDSCDFDIGLDIRCNIGIATCYSILYIQFPDKSHIQSFFKCIFNAVPTSKSELLSYVENDILESVTSDVNRLAFAFGILNTWLEQEPDKDIFFNIGRTVLEIEHGVKEAVNLGSSRVLEIWTCKLANQTIPLEVLKTVATLFPQLEFFCFMYMPGHIDAVKNCCRNILSALTTIYDRLDEESIPVPENKSQVGWVTGFLRTVLGKPVHIKWLALSCIAKKTQKSLKVLELEPDLPESLFCAQRTFKSAANDTYVALMSYHFQTTSEAVWGKTWVEPLFATQLSVSNESNWPQKRSIVSIILNSEKLRIPEIQVMITPLLKRVLEIMNRGQDINTSLENDEESLDKVPEASLLAAETIKMAYELKITIDPKELNLSCVTDTSEGSFRGLVPRPVLHNWLWSENPQIRLAGLALLVETKKTSEVITHHDFDSLKLFFKYNLLSQNPAFRQQFLSYFKKLVRRLRDGESVARRKKETEVVRQYGDFLRWLWNFFTEEEGLFCGANFGRRCQALECLSELTEHFSSFESFGITRESDNSKYLRWLTDSYEHNKIQAMEVIVRMPIKEFEDDEFCNKLFREALSLCRSVKPPDSVTGRYLMVLLMRKQKDSHNGKYSAWNLLEAVYQELERIYQQIETTSLTKVSSESPLYGCVRCVRMILQCSSDFKQKENSGKYRSYVEKLLKLCFKIDNVMFPVLGSAAPEGFLPKQTESSDKNTQIRSLASQMLLVCAWRTMKEISLLMSDMCSLFIMEGELAAISELRKDGTEPKPSAHYLLTFQQVFDIGDHLLYLLKNLVHRGVFEQVYVGFKIIANRLWKSSNHKLSSLPEKWLQDAMDQEQISAKSITRRSAGLPFIFQALLSAESDNEAFLHKWLQRLLIFDESPDRTPVRIHSMNVLRGLFRDASFSAAIMPFVPHGLKMAFRGLKSLDWTERNSGLMLYGAVMRRSFGPKLNLMNAPTFFRKFPQMYDFLLEELDTCIQTIKQRKVLTCDFTFHLLLLLASFTSSGRVEDTHFKLAEFIPRITKCGESDDMEVRKLAAKALIPFLVSPEEKRDLAMSVLNRIQELETNLTLNHLHGLLFQFLTIASQLPNEDTQACRTANAKIVTAFLNYISLESVTHSFKAPTIYETIMEIFAILHGFRCIAKGTLTKAVELMEKSYFKRFGSIKNRNFVPGLPVSDARIARAVLEIKIDELENEQLFELAYTYLRDPVRYSVYIQEFFELCQLCPKLMSSFSSVEVSDEALVVIEAALESYMDRASSLFNKFPGTQLELGYLQFMEKIPTSIFENSYSENDGVLVKALIQRLFQVCEENESTTLHVKSVALMVLGRILFSTSVPISDENKTRLCDTLLQWSTSGVDDDMRYAVAETFPCIPFQNMTSFSALHQSKIWCSLFLLAQDDESYLRQIINRKLSGGDSPCCDRKSLEVLTKIYFEQFLLTNPIEGLLLFIGLLVREDFEVEAKAADDETEDRLFDRSEMNMYFEHETLAKTFKLEMESSDSSLFAKLKLYLDTELSDHQIKFYNVVSNNPNNIVDGLASFVKTTLTVRKILSLELKPIVNEYDCDKENECLSLLRNSNDMVRSSIQQFLTEFLKLMDQS